MVQPRLTPQPRSISVTYDLILLTRLKFSTILSLKMKFINHKQPTLILSRSLPWHLKLNKKGVDCIVQSKAKIFQIPNKTAKLNPITTKHIHLCNISNNSNKLKTYNNSPNINQPLRMRLIFHCKVSHSTIFQAKASKVSSCHLAICN